MSKTIMKRGLAATLGVAVGTAAVATPSGADLMTSPAEAFDGATLVDPSNLPPGMVESITAEMNASLEQLWAGAEAPDGAYLGAGTPAESGQYAFASYQADELDFYMVSPPEGGDLGTYSVVPAGTIVGNDGSMTPPSAPSNFAAQVGQAWGSESILHQSCIVDYGSNQDQWAQNCTLWLGWKLSEENNTYDYWLVSADSLANNAGGQNRTKEAWHATRRTVAGNRLDRSPTGSTSGNCRTQPVSVGVSGFGASAGATFNFTACDHVGEYVGTPWYSAFEWWGLSFYGQDDGAVNSRSLKDAQVIRIGNGQDRQFAYLHGVRHCRQNHFGSC